jgi:hypothetical protein
VSTPQLPVPNIMSFNNFDDMMTFLAANEAAANASVVPCQRELLDGREFWYWRTVESMKIDIIGHVPSLAETLKAERATYSDPFEEDEAEEFAWSEKSLHDRLSRGYVFGRHFSVIEPKGELGDVHVSQVIPISREAFEECEAAGWRPTLQMDALRRDTFKFFKERTAH